MRHKELSPVSHLTTSNGSVVANGEANIGILDKLWIRFKPDARRGDGSSQLIEEANFDIMSDQHHNHQTVIPSISAVLPVDQTELVERLQSNGNGQYNSGTFVQEGSIIYCRHGNEYKVCCGRDLDKSVNDPDHCHAPREDSIDKRARRKLILASILCVSFMIAEVVGGYIAHSLAIMTDAAHLLTDFASFMISLFSLWVAARPATRRMSFGWYRAEVIGALTSVVLIWVVTGILVYIAIQRIINKDFEINASVMLITAAVGVGVNVVMGVSLHGVGHGHSHGGGGGGGGSHGHSHGGGEADHAHNGHAHGGEEEGKHSHESKADNINVRAAFIHVIGDFLQSIGVLIAAFIIYFRPDLGIVDPICTFLFSILVLVTTFAIMKDTLLVLMEGLPRGINFNEVQSVFNTVPNVVLVHNLRIWSLSMDKVALAAHLVVKSGSDTREILREASSRIRDKYQFFEMTLQIEDYHEAMSDCTQCENPST